MGGTWQVVSFSHEREEPDESIIGPQNYFFYGTLYEAWGQVHPALVITLAIGNIILNFLNVHW